MSTNLEVEQAEQWHEVADVERTCSRVYSHVYRLRLFRNLSFKLHRPTLVRNTSNV